jgi:hypothetical protein
MKKAKRKSASPRRQADAEDDLLPHYDFRGVSAANTPHGIARGRTSWCSRPTSPPASLIRRPSIGLCARSPTLRMPQPASRVRGATLPNARWNWQGRYGGSACSAAACQGAVQLNVRR